MIERKKSWPPSGRPGRAERPISKRYRVIDNDLARDNLENDLPGGDLEDMERID